MLRLRIKGWGNGVKKLGCVMYQLAILDVIIIYSKHILKKAEIKKKK